MTFELLHGDCRDVLSMVPEHHVDAIVTDPPYGLSFMGRDWDHDVPGPEYWRAIMLPAKPGAPLLAFGGTRTFHRLTCAIEDAGWEIRDCLMWLHAQGFPKSHNGAWGGTALKPAFEPIILARKPLEGTVAANFEAHGTGGLSIDAARIATDWSERSDAWKRSGHSAQPDAEKIAAPPGTGINCHPQGRWPANVVLEHTERCELRGTKRVRGSNPQGAVRTTALGRMNDDAWQPAEQERSTGYGATEEVEAWTCAEDCPVRMLDEQSGELRNGGQNATSNRRSVSVTHGEWNAEHAPTAWAGDRGGASRFFYCAKATRAERGPSNDHPTVKPLALMRWLVRLVSRPGAVILDPFMGSGTTGLACAAEGRNFIGCELDAHNVEIARRRLASDAPLFARRTA